MSAPYPDKAQEAGYPGQQPPQGGQGYAPVPTEPYPPQQGAYPPQQGGYPPQAYPPQQGGYPPPQQGYPPQQQGGYPPQGAPPSYSGVTAGSDVKYSPASQTPVIVGSVPASSVIVRQAQAQPNDYLAFAIIVTFCCCLPLGIVAMVKSWDVRNRYQRGDFTGAEAASRSAKSWSIAGLVLGIIVYVISVVVVIVYFVFIINVAVSAVNTIDFDYTSGSSVNTNG